MDRNQAGVFARKEKTMSKAQKKVGEILGLMRSEIERVEWSSLELSPQERLAPSDERALRAAARINLRYSHQAILEGLAQALRVQLRRARAPEQAMALADQALASLRGSRWDESLGEWLDRMRVSPGSMYWEQDDYQGVSAADLLMDPSAREALDRVAARRAHED